MVKNNNFEIRIYVGCDIVQFDGEVLYRHFRKTFNFLSIKL